VAYWKSTHTYVSIAAYFRGKLAAFWAKLFLRFRVARI
jgi:hypothetical protein